MLDLGRFTTDITTLVKESSTEQPTSRLIIFLISVCPFQSLYELWLLFYLVTYDYKSSCRILL